MEMESVRLQALHWRAQQGSSVLFPIHQHPYLQWPCSKPFSKGWRLAQALKGVAQDHCMLATT
jgi:hypothetical protein